MDTISHPTHYSNGGIECIDAIKASMSHDEYCGFLKGNVIKYIWRYRLKGGIEDIKKADVYLTWLEHEIERIDKK